MVGLSGGNMAAKQILAPSNASQSEAGGQRLQRIGKLSAKIATSGSRAPWFFPSLRAKRALARYEEMEGIALQMETGGSSRDAIYTAREAQLESAQKLSGKMWQMRVRHSDKWSARQTLANAAEKAFPWSVGLTVACEAAVLYYFHYMGAAVSFAQMPLAMQISLLISAAPAALGVLGLLAMKPLRASARRHGDLSYRAVRVVSHSLEAEKA